ncbi:MAG TPA: pantetheine-phosphate adenylyltransferase [Candidatus Nitrosocosmicus sp.]|nr:pantetheine-phosphate adenylyltransferase [Candidatus Nitrosocosmicus sp.]
MKYNHIVLGGTFDHLHIGHTSILKKAFESSDKVTIGLTKESMSQNKILFKNIQPYETREQQLKTFIQKNYPKAAFSIIPIKDIYGTAAVEKDFDAILVTKDTYKNALLINELRRQNALPHLDIIETQLITSNDGNPITSTRIRRGEINRNGFIYKNLFSHNLKITHTLKETLRVPLGIVVNGKEEDLNVAAKKTYTYLLSNKPAVTIFVGDIINSSLKSLNFIPDIAIIDHKTQRRQVRNIKNEFKYDTKNETGTINKEFVDIFIQSLQYITNTSSKQIITIKGEEDLLALPAILLAPLYSVVAYGQYNLGIVMIEVTEEIKSKVVDLLKSFIPILEK